MVTFAASVRCMVRGRMICLGIAALLVGFVSLVNAASAEAVLPAARVTIHVSSPWVLLGHSVKVTGSVSPTSSGTTVRLQRYASGKWVWSALQRLSSKSQYSFTAIPPALGVEKVRVYAPATSRHRATYSPVASITAYAPLRIVAPFFPEGTAGVPYAVTLTSSGGHGPVSWTATNLPTGLAISTSGTISGTPTASSDNTITVTASDAAGDAAHLSVSITINPARSSDTAATWTTLTAGDEHTCGIKTGGTAWCWGSNNYGQLGNSVTSGGDSTPIQVSPGSDWTALSAGYEHTCGIRSGGTAWCWGDNILGALGNPTNEGNNVPNSTPLQVGTDDQWVSISAGFMHTCGLKTDGTAWCWGNNAFGQLGSAISGHTATPTQVPGTWTSVTAGGSDTCGLKTDGTAWCWGSNHYGELGDGSTTSTATPTLVPGTWSSITAGQAQTCGIKTDNTAWCWGLNIDGELGNSSNIGTTAPNPTPTQIAGTWTSIATNWTHTCGTKSDGSTWCWGLNDLGQLGNSANNNTRSPISTPMQVAGTWAGLTVGGRHTCALGSDGTAWCWGNNIYGQLATTTNQGRARPNPTPIEVIG